MEFSLMFFAASEDDLIKDKYNLVIESARFADRNGFTSVWVPERHFIKFGYLYPNPAILQSALARETDQIRLMAGSVVAPLHDPIRVTEDWAMVDNLSGGRVGISFAPGWNPDDFVFYPEKYKDRHKEMHASIETIKQLWEGGSITKLSGNGKQTSISIYPKPVQKKLPIWITAAGNPESFIKAGEWGANLLTHILDQEAEQLGEKITLYRQSLAKNGFDPKSRKVTVMIHTFLGENGEEVKEQARKPYCDYMKSNRNIFAGLAQSRGNKVNPDTMSEEDLDDLVNFLYDRFASRRGFIGSPDNCFKLLDDLTAAGVDEVACLLDFGPHPDEILSNLPYIKILKQRYNGESEDSVNESSEPNLKSKANCSSPNPIKDSSQSSEDNIKMLSVVRERCEERLSGDQFHTQLSQMGSGLIVQYKVIESISIGSHESLGKIVIPDEIYGSKGFSTNHTVFLDSCVQLLVGAVPRAFRQQSSDFYPSGFRSMDAYQSATQTLWGHATIGRIEDDFFKGDIHLYDDHGNLVITIIGLHLQRIAVQKEERKNVESKTLIAAAPSYSTTGRYETILSELKTILGELLQINSEALDTHTSFVEMGSDSLILAAVMNKVGRKYEVRVSIRQLFEDINTLALVAKYIDEQLPQEEVSSVGSERAHVFVEEESKTNSAFSHLTSNGITQSQSLSSQTDQTFLEQVIKQQLDIMSQQIQALTGSQPPKQGPSLSKSDESSTFQTACSLPNVQRLKENGTSKTTQAQPLQKARSVASEQSTIFPKKDLKSNDTSRYSREQLNYLTEFIQSFTAKTAKSKEVTQTYRHVLADNRASVGFRFSTKEMLYPIIGKSSAGSRIWDVDGNEYVDIAMGFGVNLFGHCPSFVTEAIADQLQKGFQLGPQSEAAGEVAEMVADLTGMDRVSFHNSGTEAVMTALRLARTVTRRKKIVIFSGSYHGHFDGTLVVAEDRNENPQAIPMSLGITQNMVNDIIVLEYNNFSVLETIKDQASDIAAVLVEPVQSRKPDLQPIEFLKALRQITEQEKIALIFDEMITGFRIHPGGAQAWFGISADIATYGKIIGGGMPIGIIAGKSTFMDALDGGMWNFGDDSFPAVETTFFAGTFCKHPLAIASAGAVLKEIKSKGPELQRKLNERTTYLANSLNSFFEEYGLNIHVGHFGSLFYFSYRGDMDLFFYHLVHKGVYIWEGKTSFLSTAHSEEDVEFIITAVKESLLLLLEKGFIKSSTRDLKSTSSTSADVFEPIEKERIPLTESQQKIWISAQLEEDGSINNIPVLIQLKGDLQVKKLEEALGVVAQRHDALRTVFSEQGDYQTVLGPVPFTLPVVDISSFQNQDLEKVLEEWQLKNVREPFDLVKGPLFKAEVLRLDQSHYYLFLVTHHIIADGWSTGIIIDEIGKIYSSLVKGGVVNLESPSQFGEYIQALHAMSKTEVMGKQEHYWLDKFSKLPPLTEFTPDHSPPAIKTFKGKRIIKRLEPSILGDLSKMGKSYQASKHMILMAAYFTMFHRLTGQKDIVVGMPMASRLSSMFDHTVGCCANMLPMRSTIIGGITFLDILKQTKSELILAYENQDFSYGSLIDKLDTPRDLINNPLMELGFNFNPNISHPVLFNLESQLISPLVSYSENGLIFHVNEVDGGLVIECDFSTDLYDEFRIEGLLEIYELFLRTVIDLPTIPISEIPLVTSKERSKIMEQWNNTYTEFPSEPLQVLFENQVRKTPKRVAVAFGDKTLTYEELNKKANRLAHYLRKSYGIKPDDLVGIMTERSEWMIISILAVLKSGAAYVPIDSEYPNDRIQYVLQDASVKGVIVDRRAVIKDILLEEVPVIALKEDWPVISKSASRNPTRVSTPQHLAYVIYTSGSTGNPKGVMIEHAGVVNRIHWMWNHYNFTVEDVIFQKTTFAFDVSVWEIFMTLCYGAKMVLCKKEVIYNPAQIIEHIQAYQITTLHFVPSMLSQFLEAVTSDNMHKLQSLRHVMASGEALSLQTVKNFCQKLSIPLHNLYGPTEASVDVSYYHTHQSDAVVPIGKPISNIKLYIVDENLNLLPSGCQGEIAISGVGLSRGYLGLPTLTNEKFKESPFQAGERIYLTGDIGRWLDQGDIEYMGRKDQQVKIKGNRIELGEIENVLSNHDRIENAVVLVIEHEGNLELAAYFTSSQEFDEIEVRSYLGNKLPAYMIPSHFIQIEAIPLTSNGKADRKVLASRGSFHSRTFLEPTSEIQRKLLGIWQSILAQESISVTDNFFAIGGQSLKAIQMISRIQEEIGKKVDLRSIFIYPTISMLGDYLEGLSERKYEKIQPAPVQPFYDLSQSQKPLWLLTQLEKEFKPYNMFKELLISGEFSEPAFESAIRTIIERHESLRTSFKAVAGVPKQLIHDVEELQYDIKYVHIGDQKNIREALTNFSDELGEIVFDLSIAPLFRISVIHLDRHTHIVSLVIHHILSDGWSNDILMKEISETYSHVKDGRPAVLEPLNLQYKDYSEWEKRLLASKEFDVHKKYWHQKLEGELPVLNLPLDRPRGKKAYEGDVHYFVIDKEKSALLKDFNTKYNSTIFITLLSALNVILYKYTGQQDIIIGTPVAGRSFKELENLVGLFINSLPLRNVIDGSVSFTQFVNANKENVLEAHQHEIYPYVKLVEDLNLEYDLERNPLFDVLVVLVQQDDIFEKVEALESMKDLRRTNSTSKLDLVFYLAEGGDEINVGVEFRTDLFHKSTIKKMSEDFTSVVDSFLGNPNILIDDLKSSLLSAEKKEEQDAFEDQAAKVLSDDF